jgi:hypothetical protein
MQQAANALSTWNPGSLTDDPAVPETWIEAIFTRLSAQLGAKVADLWGGVPPETVKTEWAEALASFERAEITRGLKACQTRAFAPTLGEFLRLCRPALDPEVAWLEASEGMRDRARVAAGRMDASGGVSRSQRLRARAAHWHLCPAPQGVDLEAGARDAQGLAARGAQAGAGAGEQPHHARADAGGVGKAPRDA